MWACFGVQPARSSDADAESVSAASAVGTNNPEHERLARLAWRSAKSAEGRATVISCVAAEPSLLAKRYGFSDTLLHRAAATGQVALVSAALALARANVDVLRTAFATRNTSFPFAVEKQQRLRLAKLQDDEAVLQKLLNGSNNAGMTPLHVAAFHGHTEVLELLLRSGADPCKIDARGNRTPLHCAAITGHADCIDALMAFVNSEAAASSEAGAARGTFRGKRYIDLRTFYGLTALHYAVGRSHAAAAAALLRHEPSLYAVNPKDSTDPMLEVPSKSTPLHLAAAMGDFETCLNILRAYARNRRRRPDPRTLLNSRGRTPHKVAMVAGHRHLGELLHTSGNISTVIRPRPSEEMVPRLAAMAASALQRKLQQELNALDVELRQEQAALRQQRQQQQEERAAAARSGAGASISGSMRRPTVSGSGIAAVSVSSVTSTDSSAVCGLCMDRRTNVVAVQCQHAMCSTCALKMCGLVRTQALGCPFCRAPVRAFVAHRAASPLLATLSMDA